MAIIIESNLLIGFLRKAVETVCSIGRWLEEASSYSQSYKITARFWNGVEINFKHSFLGRISGERNILAIDNSRIDKWMLNLYNTSKLKIADYARTSAAMDLLGPVKRGIYFSPVKTGGMIAVTAILINIVFSVLLNKDITLMGWVIRSVFLFIGLSGLSCNADLEEVKKTSFVLKKGLI